MVEVGREVYTSESDGACSGPATVKSPVRRQPPPGALHRVPTGVAGSARGLPRLAEFWGKPAAGRMASGRSRSAYPLRASVRPVKSPGSDGSLAAPFSGPVLRAALGPAACSGGGPPSGSTVCSAILAMPGGPEVAVNRKSTTLSGGSLGSCIDEERSQLR